MSRGQPSSTVTKQSKSPFGSASDAIPPSLSSAPLASASLSKNCVMAGGFEEHACPPVCKTAQSMSASLTKHLCDNAFRLVAKHSLQTGHGLMEPSSLEEPASYNELFFADVRLCIFGRKSMVPNKHAKNNLRGNPLVH